MINMIFVRVYIAWYVEVNDTAAPCRPQSTPAVGSYATCCKSFAHFMSGVSGAQIQWN